MIVEKLPGTDARLYALVAPLVMSVPIIRQNNNYPFKTSRKHLWFIALERGEVKVLCLLKEKLRELVSIITIWREILPNC